MQGTYGGCGGNDNKFKTKKECKATCSLGNGDMDDINQSSIIKYLQKLEHLMQNIARKIGAKK